MWWWEFVFYIYYRINESIHWISDFKSDCSHFNYLFQFIYISIIKNYDISTSIKKYHAIKLCNIFQKSSQFFFKNSERISNINFLYIFIQSLRINYLYKIFYTIYTICLACNIAWKIFNLLWNVDEIYLK